MYKPFDRIDKQGNYVCAAISKCTEQVWERARTRYTIIYTTHEHLYITPVEYAQSEDNMEKSDFISVSVNPFCGDAPAKSRFT